jgi:hypothetical protein
MELKDVIQYWPNLADAGIDAELCEKVPTRKCEAFDHRQFHFCEPCGAEQFHLCSRDSTRARAQTQQHFCLVCTNALNVAMNDYASNASINASIGNCSCLKQVDNTWICLAHRLNSVLRVEKRALKKRNDMYQNSGGQEAPCPNCQMRTQDLQSNVWKCLSCDGNVIVRF